ncbi:MAG: hypothetical protein M0T84_02455 [Betaproteobacteria bacterium]|nr:hypothetical protein [Betaproteobacteria bacterium]
MCTASLRAKPARDTQAGATLIEAVIFIAIVGIALPAILQVMDFNVRHSADGLLRIQSATLAESMLNEIESKDFCAPRGGFEGPYTPGNRRLFDAVTDYRHFSMYPVTTLDGTVVPGLQGYRVSAAVTPSALGGIPSSAAYLITVTVTDPGGERLVMSGYRVNDEGRRCG